MTVTAVLPTTQEGWAELESSFSKTHAEMIVNIINRREDLSSGEKLQVFHKVIDKLSSLN